MPEESSFSVDPARGLPDGDACELTEDNLRQVEALRQALREVRKVVVGQDSLLERILISLLANGHVLIEGVPGLAKTKTIKAFSEALGGRWQRVQFTPDLVPSDVTGTRLWNPAQGSFSTELGPVYTNFLLADEVNRAPAKVQSALLEAMEERQVTIGNTTYALPEPFFVLATQNPVENEGTFPLPEAQTDRFLMRVVVTYPAMPDELEIVYRHLATSPTIDAVTTPEQLAHLSQVRKAVRVDKEVAEYAVRMSNLTRKPEEAYDHLQGSVLLGAGIRGTLALVSCAQARALLRGRDHVVIGDLHNLAQDVLAHRIVTSFDATLAGITPQDIVSLILTYLGNTE